MNWALMGVICAVLCDSAVVITVGLKLKGWAEGAVKDGVHELMETGADEIATKLMETLTKNG